MFVLKWNLLLALLSTWYRYWWDRNTLAKKCNNEPIGSFELPVSAIWSATNRNNSHNMTGNNSRKKLCETTALALDRAGNYSKPNVEWASISRTGWFIRSWIRRQRQWFFRGEGGLFFLKVSTSLTWNETDTNRSSALPLELWPRSPTILGVQLTL